MKIFQKIWKINKRTIFFIRNLYSHWYNQFDLFRIGKYSHLDRTEFVVSILGIQFVLSIDVKVKK
jgi:hypothetical protein